MQNNRITDNPSNQNEEYYTLSSFRASRDGIDYSGDYYLMSGRPIGTTPGFRESGKYKRFVISKEPITGAGDQFCINVKQEFVGKVLEAVDWETAYIKFTTWDLILRPDFHQAFNKKRLEMGL